MQATMEATIGELDRWLQSIFPDGKIERGWVNDEAYLLFRVYRADGNRSSEIQFTEIALEDYSAVDILHDLEAAGVAEQMHTRTSHRFTYGYGRARDVTPIERMIVVCDGLSYRVVRGLDRAVSVFDDQGRQLAKLPPSLVLPDSIFRRHASQWQADIRAWR